MLRKCQHCECCRAVSCFSLTLQHLPCPGWKLLPAPATHAFRCDSGARKDRCRKTFDMGPGRWRGQRKKKHWSKTWERAGVSASCPPPASRLRGSVDLQERLSAGRAAAACDTAARTSLPHSPALLLIRITHDSCRHRQQGRETVVCNYKELWTAAPWQYPSQAGRAVCDRLCAPCHLNRRSPAAKRAWAVRGLAWKGEKFSCSMSYLGR